MTTRIVEDFVTEIIRVSGLAGDADSPSGPCWAKYVDQVDLRQRNGYMFVGDFLHDGTDEIMLGSPRVILAQASTPDRSMRSGFLRRFAVVILLAGGGLHPTNIRTDDKRSGWAFRIRDQVIDLLGEIYRASKPGLFSAVDFIDD